MSALTTRELLSGSLPSTYDFSAFEKSTVLDVFQRFFRRPILTFDEKESCGTVLKTLDEHNIQSCPILNDLREVIGVADVQKIMLLAVGMYPHFGQSDPLPSLDNNLNLKDTLASKFENIPIGEIVKGIDAFQKGVLPVFKVKPSTPVKDVLDMFGQGVHRVLVMDEQKDDKIITQISQSDFLSVLAIASPFFNHKTKNTSIKDLGLLRETPLVSAKEDDLVLLGLQKMVAHQINSLPVVNASGCLFMMLSSTNIRGVTQMSFGDLSSLTIQQYLLKNSQSHNPSSTKALTALRDLHPIFVSEKATFELVVALMASTHSHRLFVTNSEHHPIAVISLGDLFQVFLPWSKKD